MPGAASPIWLDYHKAVNNHDKTKAFTIPPGIWFGSVNAQGLYLGEGLV